jgi:hypothetical protein
MQQASASAAWLSLSLEVDVSEQAATQVPEEVEFWFEDTPHGPQLHYAAYDASGDSISTDVVGLDESGTRFHIDLASDSPIHEP